MVDVLDHETAGEVRERTTLVINAAIGLGANLGNPSQQIRDSITCIDQHAQIQVLEVSRFYRSEPMGPISDQPHYVNAAITISTSLSARSLLDALKQIERDMGRSPDAARWGPREIDCDILLFGQETVNEIVLTIPHKGLELRPFVLCPLAEIAGDWCLPDGRTIESLEKTCDTQGLAVMSDEVEYV